MNKRIRELAEQSGFFPVPDDTEWDFEYRAENARYEKFAELMVKECVSLFDGTREMKTIGMLTHEQVIKQIKQHFGVE